MKSSPIVVADADVIVAQAHPEDVHHLKAGMIAQRLMRAEASVLYPVTAVTEAVTHLQRALSNGEAAFKVAQLMSSPAALVVEVNQQTLTNAMRYFSPKASKKNTLFDCIVAAVAEEIKADAIFSFDRFYKAQGFTLASELL